MNVQRSIRAEEPQRYRLKQEDYLLLDQSGSFARFARTELIEGEVIAVNAQYSLHGRVQKRLYRALSDACEHLSGGVEAWFEVSIDLSPDSLPTPDLFVALNLPENAPAPVNSVMLIVEVSESTLRDDLTVKARLYATAGVPEYWVADVNGRVIHQMWSPVDGRYIEHESKAFGETVTAKTMDDLLIDTDTL